MADDLAENLSKSMTTDHSVTVRVQGPEESVIKLLSSIKEVESVTSLGIVESGSIDLLVEPVKDADIRRAIFERLAERKWPILELSTKQLTLEQIFLRLTEGVSYTNDESPKSTISDNSKKTARKLVYGEEEK